MELYKQGAEARLYTYNFLGRACLVKERFNKLYRHSDLDKCITNQRMKNEVRAMIRCRQSGIRTPSLYYVDTTKNAIYMEYLADCLTMKQYIDNLIKAADTEALDKAAIKIGQTIALLHENNIVHGDLTTSNILVNLPDTANTNTTDTTNDIELVLIDFGLTCVESAHNPEDKGVDLYVLERAFMSTHPNTERVFELILSSYSDRYGKSKDVIEKLNDVRLRGRKRTMVG